jgi:hypothetical protein
MKNYIIFLLLLIGISTNAQDILSNKISWNSNNTVNLTTNSAVQELTTFISNKTVSFVWENETGTIRKNYRIIEAIGEWPDITEDGRIQYEVTDGHFSGTIYFSKQSNVTKIKIAMKSSPPETAELTISGFQVN